MITYADGSSSLGTTTMPPTRSMVSRDARLVTRIDHIGKSTARTASTSTVVLLSESSAEGFSSQAGRVGARRAAAGREAAGFEETGLEAGGLVVSSMLMP